MAGARLSLGKALDANPGDELALVQVVNMHLAAHRRDEAVRTVEAQVAKAPNNARVLVIAGRTYALNGNLDKSEAVLRRAIDVDPSMLEAYHVLGQILVRQKKLDEATKAYEARAAARPDDVSAHTMVAMIQLTQGKMDAARSRFEKVLSIDPRAAVASNNLAYIDAEEGTNLDVALSRAQTAKAALPDDADVNDTLGWVYVRRGLPALAVGPLEQAIQKNPSEPVYRCHLGVAHLKAGDKDRARVELGRALQLSSATSGSCNAKRELDSLGS
jgi:Tfp pilus assembly protein PilF